MNHETSKQTQTTIPTDSNFSEQPKLAVEQLNPAGNVRLFPGVDQTVADSLGNKCVHELFEVQVGLTASAVAVVFDDQQLSFADLNARANQLAHHLRNLGVGPGSLVGICIERSIEMLIGLLGVLKAGAAYVPLDPAYPQARLAFMLADANVSVLLTQQQLSGVVPKTSARAICLDADWDVIAKQRTDNPVAVVTAEDLAYVMYTSGSTGQPKGVMIQHRGLANYLSWCTRAYEVSNGCGALVHSSLAFDLTITSLFPPLLAGRTVFLLPEAGGVEALAEALLGRDNYSLLKITPAHLRVLSELLPADEIAGRVRALIIGGEALSFESLSLWREHAPATRLINEYGPTETVVGCCVYEVGTDDPESGAVPIGRAIANTLLYVLDETQQPAGVGVVGELYIGGNGVASGYLQRAELTAANFIPDLFSKRMNARLYKTGDLARYLPNGNLEFIGRNDSQVKVRGFRIELGEIEQILNQHWAVCECVVLAREDATGDRRLVGYVVPTGVNSLTTDELRACLQAKLPEYMVPTTVLILDSLPLTPNGKVDRQALAALADSELDHEQEFVAPRSPFEETLSRIWADVLQIERVGINDNFFELGGDSILATLVLARAARVELRLSPVQLFEHQTIARLSEAMATAEA